MNINLEVLMPVMAVMKRSTARMWDDDVTLEVTGDGSGIVRVTHTLLNLKDTVYVPDTLILIPARCLNTASLGDAETGGA